jgi:hypothetical protein
LAIRFSHPEASCWLAGSARIAIRRNIAADEAYPRKQFPGMEFHLGNRDVLTAATLHALTAESDLHQDHAGQTAAGTRGAEEGVRGRGSQ